MKPEHDLQFDVQIFDTDCFGVIWHGAYTKWLELGRVSLFKQLGIEMSKPNEPGGWIYPVVDQHFQFKSPAQMGDPLTLKTSVTVEGYKLLFQQVCTNETTGKVTITVQTTVVVLDMQWRLQRKLPQSILKPLQEAEQLVGLKA